MNEISLKYRQGFGLDAICKEFHIGKLKAKEIITSDGIAIRAKSSFRKHKEAKHCASERFPKVPGIRYKLVSKDGKFSTYDYLNKSGEITEYVSKLGVKLDSSYKRRKMFEDTGIFWWEDYFDITTEKIKDKKVCPYCGWSTIDVENKSGAFEVHLLKEHGISKEEYLKEHPEDKKYFSLVCKTKNRQLETDENKFVTCAICGKKLASIDSRHLSSHGISKKEYIMRYGACTTSSELHSRLSSITKELNKTIEHHYTSEPEKEIMAFIKSLGIKCEKNRSILNGKELDVYIPEFNIAIEFNGCKYHTEQYGGKYKNYHLEKTLACKKAGVNLIHIFEDEYMYHRDIVLSKVRHLLRADNNLPRIAARKCSVKEISKGDAFAFLKKYHIQGPASATVYLGAFYNDKLCAVMTFRKESSDAGCWELNRFASDYRYVMQGIGGKLFKYFTSHYDVIEIKSFMDRKWCSSETSNIYTTLGFEFDRYTYPDYRYFNSSVDRYARMHKFNFRKQFLHRKYGLDISLTEKEMMQKLGYDRIWDCGLIKYKWRRL